MRVISGLAKSLKLSCPNTHKVRPAADKVKGAIFNILGEITDFKVLDLFAGTGSVGIEALSRGALSCLFIEADRMIAGYIQKNLAHCRLEDSAQVWIMTVQKALTLLARKKETFDLIFIDPPYNKNLVNPSIKQTYESGLLHDNSIVVIEHSPQELPSKETLEIFDTRHYGQTRISFLKKH